MKDNGSIDLHYYHLKQIANTPHEVIETFKNTPIFHILCHRKMIAQAYISRIDCGEDLKEVGEAFKYVNTELKKYFLLFD